MQYLREKLVGLVDSYFEVERNKHKIEGETAYVMTNSKYYENMRHSLNHLMRAFESYLKPEQPDLPQFEEQFGQANHHLSNLDVNGYEYLAGVFLAELADKLEASSFFYSTGNASEFRKRALQHFDLGRETRTPDKKVAMAHFEKCIEECKLGIQEIKPVSALDRRNYFFFGWTLFFSIIACLLALIAIFK